MATDKDGKEIVEPKVDDESTKTDAELEAELADLESKKGGAAPDAGQGRSELDKATFSAKSTLKRIKELGGDPASLLDDEPAGKPEAKPLDTSEFVTKKDLARADAQKLAKSPTELKLMQWWMDNRGLSAEDAHFMANKNRIRKVLGEVGRSEAAIPSPAGAGPGERPAETTEAPALPEGEVRRLTASGMIYDPAKMAYVGKKIQHRYDKAAKGWVTEKL